MPFTLQHVLVSEALLPATHETAEGTYFTVNAQGSFQLLYPGSLQKGREATVRHNMRIDVPDTSVPEPPPGIDGVPGHPLHPIHPLRPPHGGVDVTLEPIPLELRLFDPNGQEFTRDDVTLSDLQRFRDLRGTPIGLWTYTLTGRSRLYVSSVAFNETVSDPKGVINLGLLETVASASALPLVARTRLDGGRLAATFDLNRVGTFLATITPSNTFDPWHGSMRLIDPDGTRVASTTSRELRCPIPLSALGKSRDVAGNPRLWTLEVSPQGGVVVGNSFVTATVLGEGRVGTSALQQRIQKLLGPNGKFIKLAGDNSGGQARALLTIKNVVAAETIDMHGLLDSRLREENQSTDVEVDKPIVLYQRSADLDYGLRLDVSTIKVSSINVEAGPGRGLGPGTPALRLVVKTEGAVKVTWHGATLANAALRDGRLELEVGIRIDADGTPRIVQNVPNKPFDIDLNAGIVAAMIGALGVVGGVTALAIAEYVEQIVNDRFSDAAAHLFHDPSLAARMLMMIFGVHLTYLPVRFEGADILFEHIAPQEPDPRPRHDYAGAIGRAVAHEATGPATFRPRTLGDTWAADNLESKIDHIVVVMMENRSYDHVLGYRALQPINDGADGLTEELMAIVNGAVGGNRNSGTIPPVRPLRKAGFEPNALGLRTRIPKDVGHALEDVRQQLSGQIEGPGGRKINDPNGFVDNFRDRELHGKPEGENGCIPFDVLGYYEKNEAEGANDLPIFAFLAESYAYCDRYFCSHPGPTFPNRMYSLTGDVQYDRLGVPILNNNHGDNFLLSRAATIYDLLTRKGVSWRVYESNPSLSMLRMFARYATDDVNIRPLDELAGDVAAGNLPSFTVIEPAMHHHPQDDDHPDADMYRGQIFIRRVYEDLRSNPDVWRKTLLLITYDEHGGLYDHVIPPIADVLNARAPSVVSDGPRVSTGESSTAGESGGAASGSHGRFGPRIAPEAPSVLPSEPGLTAPTPAAANIEIPYGVRVPTFVVSPWVTPGKGPSVTLDHCSILKTVLARFCGEEKPFLNDRVRVSHSFESFLRETQPRMDVGEPPVLGRLPITERRVVAGAGQIVTPPLFRKRMREEHVDFHDVSGRLARMLGR
jgi:phospholipase C